VYWLHYISNFIREKNIKTILILEVFLERISLFVK